MASINANSAASLLTLVAAALLFPTGCSKPTEGLDQNWAPPVSVTSSIGGLGGAARLHKYQDALMGVQVQRDRSANLLFWSRTNNSWSEAHFTTAPKGYIWGFAAIHPQSGRCFLPEGYTENERLVMKVLIGTITEKASLRDLSEKTLITDKNTLLGETGPNVKLNAYAKHEGIGLGLGIINDSEVYIPYSLHATTLFGINNASNGPFANGVFYSSDSGNSWRIEKISELRALAPALCRTTKYVYYFAGVYPLWFSRRSADGGAWETPQAITKTFTGVSGRFDVVDEGDTTHICWMDRRHNKMRFNLTGPPVENNDIYYRRRNDADREWSKEVLLSEGLLYCYAPTMSAEGDNVVVAWAGIQTADRQHTDMGPNDIYYVTTKDGGKTWTKPLRVTDGAKDGITAGMPQVALLNGVIHLLYTQSARRSAKEISPGLTRLGAEPWPIYYQQRLFPD